jgi:hypothetical protein
MDITQSMDRLSKQFTGKDWFHSVGQDQSGRIVVYVHWMNNEVSSAIPASFEGKQVLEHFAVSATVSKDQFFVKPSEQPKPPMTPTAFIQAAKEAQAKGIDTFIVGASGEDLDDIVSSVDEEKSLRHLQNELDRLEKVCGSYSLQDIFYEVQDGKNAVTNMSERYPDVRKSMEKLYKQYGFNVIYEELDG